MSCRSTSPTFSPCDEYSSPATVSTFTNTSRAPPPPCGWADGGRRPRRVAESCPREPADEARRRRELIRRERVPLPDHRRDELALVEPRRGAIARPPRCRARRSRAPGARLRRIGSSPPPSRGSRRPYRGNRKNAPRGRATRSSSTWGREVELWVHPGGDGGGGGRVAPPSPSREGARPGRSGAAAGAAARLRPRDRHRRRTRRSRLRRGFDVDVAAERARDGARDAARGERG